jgi:hypothetical protein
LPGLSGPLQGALYRAPGAVIGGRFRVIGAVAVEIEEVRTGGRMVNQREAGLLADLGEGVAVRAGNPRTAVIDRRAEGGAFRPVAPADAPVRLDDHEGQALLAQFTARGHARRACADVDDIGIGREGLCEHRACSCDG